MWGFCFFVNKVEDTPSIDENDKKCKHELSLFLHNKRLSWTPPPQKKKYINKNKPSGPLSRSAHDFVLFSIVKLMKTLHNGEDKRKTFYSENQLLSQA